MSSLILILFGIWGANAATHSLQYFYTATTGISNFPRFIDLGILNGEAISMYDSTTQKKIPKQKWMAENLDQQYWDSTTELVKGTEQTFYNNIQVAMSRFNQTAGVHTVQQMYGCEWDDETGATNGFNQFGYDGEDFLNLDLKDQRWISPVQQGFITTRKWNNDKANLENVKQYLNTECIEWLKKYVQYGKSSLKKYVQYGKSSLKKTVSPQVSLLQKDHSSSVTCHATGFYPSGVTITWMNNGREHHEDVEVGELLPNEDGTFQKTSTLRVTPDEWKKNKFSCVVEHKGIIKEENEIRTNNGNSLPIGIIVGVVAAVVLLIVMAGIGYKIYQKKKGFKPVNGSEEALCSNSSAHAEPHA